MPAAHLSHVALPFWSAYVPVPHGVTAVAPVAQNEPTLHSLQPTSDVTPAALLYRPAGHSVTADAPTEQNPPTPHCAQSDEPTDAWNVPAAHSVHAPWPT